IGRRLRLGRVIADDLGLDPDDGAWLMADPPPPYDLVAPAWDGRAMWRSGSLAIDITLLPDIPPEPASTWVAEDLIYRKDAAFTADGVTLHLRPHRGGRLDWYSVDAEGGPAQPAQAQRVLPPVAPARIQYPGMPRSGIWEIEDRESDVGGMAPDAAHTATAIMTALFFSHRDEWFDIPVPGSAGTASRIVGITVTDAFGEPFESGFDADGTPFGPTGLHPPGDVVTTARAPLTWGVFRTVGLPAGELILWQAVDRPLEGEVIERVQFGVDDQSNIVWAVERRLEQRDPPPVPPGDEESIVPPVPSDLTRGQGYHYVPGQGGQAHWIPYTMTGDGEPRGLVRRQLMDLSVYPPRRFPAASARVLAGPDDDGRRIAESVVPIDGLQVERRWMLARDAAGAPHLWVQRRRGPLFSPPARTLRFDVAAPTDAPPG
ncbi:MAG TPA: hypothetical protein VF253_01935, partial [Candidatus Limnocylindrales bacterium]